MCNIFKELPGKLFINIIYIIYMIQLLVIVTSSKAQVLPLCNQQSDCQIGTYCGNTNLCYDCSYIYPGECNTLNTNCCSLEFLKQCTTNPYQCTVPSNPPTPITQKTHNLLFMFTIIFFIVSINYLILGFWVNKYHKQKVGLSIVPNYNSWCVLYGLVKDGIHFTRMKFGNRLGYNVLE